MFKFDERILCDLNLPNLQVDEIYDLAPVNPSYSSDILGYIFLFKWNENESIPSSKIYRNPTKFLNKIQQIILLL